METIPIINENLLLTCIDETDTKNPGQWVSDKAEYDLIFLCYSENQQFLDDLKSLGRTVLPVSSGKWKNIKWFWDNFGYGQYQYFWFPDPDLEIEVGKINEFFKFVKENRLDLCQPSLTPNSHNSHKFHKQSPDSNLRKVSFVEIMCPCFSLKALRELSWTFDLSFSGYGLDLLWSCYFDCYVIDRFSARHPRPPQFAIRAKKKGFPEPNDELRKILEEFNLEPHNGIRL